MKRIISNQLRSAQNSGWGFDYPSRSERRIEPRIDPPVYNDPPGSDGGKGKAIEIWENAGEEDAEKLVQAVAEEMGDEMQARELVESGKYSPIHADCDYDLCKLTFNLDEPVPGAPDRVTIYIRNNYVD